MVCAEPLNGKPYDDHRAKEYERLETYQNFQQKTQFFNSCAGMP